MPHVYQSLYAIMVLLACGFTAWAGGRTEKIGLAIVIIASLVSYPATILVPARWGRLMIGTALVDLATSAAFLILMLRSRRFWPIWAFGFCIAMMMAHLMRLLQSVVPAWSYYDTTSLWAYPVMIAVVIGAIGHRWGKPTNAF